RVVGALLRLLALFRRRLNGIPAAVVVLLPASALIPVHVAVAPGIHVAASRACHAGSSARSAPRDRFAAAAALRRSRRRTRHAVGDARRACPLIASLDGGLAPTTVDARTLPRRPDGTGPRVVSSSRATRAIRSVRRRAASIGSGPRVVPCADTG